MRVLVLFVLVSACARTVPSTPRLRVEIVGDLGRVVACAPHTIRCPGACREDLARGTRVILHALPSPGVAFTGWEGACGGTDACVVALDGPRNVIARFAPRRSGTVARAQEPSCPIPRAADALDDEDHDKLADAVDACPGDPEDYDRFEDEDGCPESDNDEDGIPDVTDLCPQEQENHNGYEDDDGCPERSTATP